MLSEEKPHPFLSPRSHQIRTRLPVAQHIRLFLGPGDRRAQQGPHLPAPLAWPPPNLPNPWQRPPRGYKTLVDTSKDNAIEVQSLHTMHVGQVHRLRSATITSVCLDPKGSTRRGVQAQRNRRNSAILGGTALLVPPYIPSRHPYGGSSVADPPNTLQV
jgi:hypothetical protein